MNTKNLKLISAIIAVSSLCLIALGGFVRATGAGLSCPDWPLCYGRAVPDYMVPGVMQEVGHRYLAGIVTLLTIFLAVKTYLYRNKYPRLWQTLRTALLVLLIQILLGGLTIFLKLNPFIVTSHLATGTLFFQIFALITLEKISIAEIDDPKILKLKRRGNQDNLKKAAKNIFLVLSLAMYLQILIGGFVGSSGASLACPDIPFCYAQSSAASYYGGMQHLQLTHRFFGLFLLVATLAAAIVGKNNKYLSRKQYQKLMIISGMFLLQIALGLANVYWRIPVNITLLHLLLAEMILLKLIRLYKEASEIQFFYDKTLSSRDEESEIFSSKKKYKHSKYFYK